MSVLGIWDELGWELDFDVEPDAAIYAEEALTASSGAVWWSAAAAVFDHDLD